MLLFSTVHLFHSMKVYQILHLFKSETAFVTLMISEFTDTQQTVWNS